MITQLIQAIQRELLIGADRHGPATNPFAFKIQEGRQVGLLGATGID